MMPYGIKTYIWSQLHSHIANYFFLLVIKTYNYNDKLKISFFLNFDTFYIKYLPLQY